MEANGSHATFLRQMRQRVDSSQRQQKGAAQVPVHGMPLPRSVRAGGRAQSRPVRPGRCPVKRAQLAAQHCSAHGRGAHDDCQTDKKKRRSPCRPCRRDARRKPSASGGKCWNSMNCGVLWAVASVRFGCGSWSNAPGGVLWAGRWAAGAKRLCASCGRPCRHITAATAGSSPTGGKPTPRFCPAGSTGPAPRARAKPAS